jgi:esterase/lipase
VTDQVEHREPPSGAPEEQPFAHDGGPVGVVLSHGFTGTPASMRPWADHLAAAGYTVRLPLLPGHGGTWQDTNRTRWPQWYAAIERAYDEVAARCDVVFAGGLSMGGTLVTRLAEQKGDAVAGLVLVNPSFGTMRLQEKLAPYISWLVRSRPSIGGDIKKPGVEEPANDRTPVVAGASLVRMWKVVAADCIAASRTTSSTGCRRSCSRRARRPRRWKKSCSRTAITSRLSTMTPNRSSLEACSSSSSSQHSERRGGRHE